LNFSDETNLRLNLSSGLMHEDYARDYYFCHKKRWSETVLWDGVALAK